MYSFQPFGIILNYVLRNIVFCQYVLKVTVLSFSFKSVLINKSKLFTIIFAKQVSMKIHILYCYCVNILSTVFKVPLEHNSSLLAKVKYNLQ